MKKLFRTKGSVLSLFMGCLFISPITLSKTFPYEENGSVRVDTVQVNLSNPSQDQALNQRIIDQVRKNIAIFPGEIVSEDKLDFLTARLRNSLQLQDLSYDAETSMSGGLNLTLNVTLGDNLVTTGKGYLIDNNKKTLPLLYDRDGKYLKAKLELLSMYYGNNNSWYGQPEKMLNGNPLVDAKPADRIIGEMSRATSMLRDLLNNDFDNVIVDTPELYNEAKGYVHNVAPEKEKIVKLHQSKTKLFEQLGIEKQLKMLFGRSVSLPGGGYLIVEHTEALHVIDVNSGNKSNSEEDQEATALSVNREAAKEVARQLRLRDMGGIIVIDFIDMKKADNRKLIQDIMRDEMRGDRSKYTILPLTKFGLMQITRQRVRPEMNVATHETCPSCGGTGSITASIAVSDIVEQHLEHLVTKQNEKKLTILAHPFLSAYFTKGFPSIRMKWFLKYKTWITIMEDSSFGITEFKFLNQNGDQIEISS